MFLRVQCDNQFLTTGPKLKNLGPMAPHSKTWFGLRKGNPSKSTSALVPPTAKSSTSGLSGPAGEESAHVDRFLTTVSKVDATPLVRDGRLHKQVETRSDRVTKLWAEIGTLGRKLNDEMQEIERSIEELARARAQLGEVQSEATSLRTELAAARRNGERTEKELARARARLTELKAERGGLRAQVETLESKLAAEEKEKLEAASKVAELESALEIARDATAALKGAAEASARRAREGDRLHYVLACNGQTGSIARSILASEPESLLYKTFCGEWDYARDDSGRAIVTCHPDRWAAVLEHLTTGAVPKQRDSQLLEQARFWNLQRLTSALEALTPGVVVSNADSQGFTVRGTFVSVMNFSKQNLPFVTPQSHVMKLHINESGIWVYFQPDSDDIPADAQLSYRCRVLVRDNSIVKDWSTATCEKFKKYESWERPPAEGSEKGWGHTWRDWGHTLHQMASEPLALAHDSLVVEFEVRYLDE
ncbi:hypothetical protein KFL_004840070 [Klebsormidium nitens]|uniref:Uncharacterized protein n=1 Tax=Klebsormidium nitens TaxID=105231 RepID=A0A1Y1IK76_KLENI|nr:hypothetical protein KFL_004840070 [Klebsormidium nitens]|eukprot:GAQ89067.1 hypothetical protein KFL_004840070 [Klebsormidium nitens]